MSKRNKVIYSNIQPNTKEAGVWVNTNDGNIKVEKDGKWVDDGGEVDKPQSVMIISDFDYGYACEIDILNSKIVFYRVEIEGLWETKVYSTFESFIEEQQDSGSCACWPVVVDWDNKLMIMDFFKNNASNSGHPFYANVTSSIFMKGYSEHDSVTHKVYLLGSMLYKSSSWLGTFTSNDTVYKKESDELVKIYEIFDGNDQTIFTVYRYKSKKDLPK